MSPRRLAAGRIGAVIGSDAGCSIVDQIAVSAFNFAIGIVAARLLGVADFGLFTIVLMISTLAGTLQGHVLTVPMMTLAGSRAKRSRSYFDTVLLLGVGFSAAGAILVALLVAGLLALRGDPVPAGLLAAVAFVTFAQNQQMILRRVFFAERRRVGVLVLDGTRIGVMTLLIAAIAGLGLAIDVATLLGLLGLAALVSTLPFSGYITGRTLRRRLFGTVLARHWPIARWLVLVLVVSIGQEQAIWVLAGLELGDEAVGGLRAGQYLLGTTHFMVMAIENFMPRTAADELRTAGRAGLRAYIARQTVFVAGAVAVLAAAIAVFAEDLLTLAFGASFAAYGDVTRIFAGVYVLTVVRTIWLHYLRAIEDTRSIFVSFAISSSCAVLLIYPAMLAFGIEGVAFTILIAQGVCLIAVAAAVLRHERASSAREAAIPDQVPEAARS